MSPAERAVPHQPSAIPFHTILSLDPIIDGTNARENNIKTAEVGVQCSLVTNFVTNLSPNLVTNLVITKFGDKFCDEFGDKFSEHPI